MSETPNSANSDSAAQTPADDVGVLANLPRTRPQRASPRRARARAKDVDARTASLSAPPASNGGKPRPKPKPKAKAPRETTATKPRRTTAAKPRRTTTTNPRQTTAAQPRQATAAQPRKTSPAVESVPEQGYETEDDTLRGPVRPPGSAELMTSAAELAGELAKTGVSTGARLVRDLLSRLPG